MLFRDIYKILIVAEPQGADTPMRRNGEAIVRHLIDTHHIKVDIVRNTRDALTDIERDASVATVLIEWGKKGDGIDTVAIIARMRDIGLEAPVFIVVFNRDDIAAIRQLLRDEVLRRTVWQK